MAQSKADEILEEWRGDGKIDTTRNGIGPGYANKSLRIGMRIEELQKSPEALKDRYLEVQRYAKEMFGIVLASNEEDAEVAKLLIARSMLGPRVVEDMTKFWAKEIAAKSRILAECSQGYDLHIDGPRYPNVTSSQTNAHGQLNGLQIPRAFGNRAKLVGCIKAYNTFVGSGHSRTRMPDDVRARIQQVGKERGTITGRWRETNWLDLEKLQGGPMANENPDSIAMMKLDVYDNEPEIKVAVGSNDDGSPVYVTFPGWMQSTRGIQNFKDLPAKACDYIDFVERALQCPIHFIGTGPSEDDMIDRRPKS
jgi:adenylosuccinate synthase